MTTYETIEIETPAEHVALVRLNRPDSLNAMNTQISANARVAPAFAKIASTLKVGKSLTLVTKAGFPAVALVSSTPKVCVVAKNKVTAKAKGSCVVKASVESALVRTIRLTVTK